MNDSDNLYYFFLPLFESVISVQEMNKISFLNSLQNSNKYSRANALLLINNNKANWSLYGQVISTLNRKG